MTFKTDVVLPSELSDEDIAIWNSLNGEAPGRPAAFLSYTYAHTAEKVFRDVRVCRITRNERPVLFFPFQYRSLAHRWFGIGQRLAGELSDYFGVVAQKDVKIDPLALLRMCGLNALLFTHLDESQAAFGLVGEAPELGHIVDFPEGGEAFWNERRSLDKKFVQDTERREKKLARDLGPISFAFECASASAGLEHLIAAKRKQYQRTGAGDVFEDHSARHFLRLLSEEKHPQCSGILSTLYAGNTWIASHFGLRCNQTLHYWFPVYNPEVSSYGPGRLLIRKIVEAGASHGILRIDRGAGDTVAKRDLSSSQHKYYRGLWSRNGGQALAYRIVLSLAWRFSRTTGK